MEISPYVEWLVLRALVKDNNKELRSRIYWQNGKDPDAVSYGFRVIGDNFLYPDADAHEKYVNELDYNNWLNKLSNKDLFSFYNYQNKILNRRSILDIDTVAFNVMYNEMKYIDKKIEFSGQPPKEEKDKKGTRPKFESTLATIVLANNVERCCDEYENFTGKKVLDNEIFDPKKGFNLGGYQLLTAGKIAIREKYKKTQETKETENDLQPLLPGFEDFKTPHYDYKKQYETEIEF